MRQNTPKKIGSSNRWIRDNNAFLDKCTTMDNLKLLTQKAALFSVSKAITESSSLSFRLLPRPSRLSSISLAHNMPTHAAILRNCQYLKLVLWRLTLAAIQTSESHTCQFSCFLCHIYRTTVCWDLQILLRWRRDVTTSPSLFSSKLLHSINSKELSCLVVRAIWNAPITDYESS